MEMQDISEGKERKEDAGEPMLQVQPEGEAESDQYEQLKGPSENVYAETHGRTSDKTKAGKQSGGNTRRYRAACMFLGLICLALLLAVIILSMKLQAGSTFCSDPEQSAPTDKRRPSFGPACGFDQCQAYFSRVQPEHCQCRRCAPGWKAFGRSCFYFSTIRLNWDESLQNCTSRGGSLAIVSSQKLQSFLAKEGSLTYWIGLREMGAAWTWVNRTVLRESHWAERPLNGDCVVLSGGRPPEKNWIKASCRASTYFICQLDF